MITAVVVTFKEYYNMFQHSLQQFAQQKSGFKRRMCLNTKNLIKFVGNCLCYWLWWEQICIYIHTYINIKQCNVGIKEQRLIIFHLNFLFLTFFIYLTLTLILQHISNEFRHCRVVKHDSRYPCFYFLLSIVHLSNLWGYRPIVALDV